MDVMDHIKRGARCDWDKRDEDSEWISYEHWKNSAPPPSSVPWARLAAYAVIDDLSDRRGIRQEMDQIDDDIRAEIVEKLEVIIAAAHREGAHGEKP